MSSSSLVPSAGRVLALIAATALGCVACSSSSTPGGSSETNVTASGTLGGKTFTVGSSVAISGGTKAEMSGPSIALYVGAGSQFSSCSALEADLSAVPADASGFFFSLLNGGSPLSTGTYTLTNEAFASGQTVQAESIITDAQCNDSGLNATAGTVTVSAVDATSASGSYNLTFGTDHLSGTFSVSAFCPLPAEPDAAPTCASP